MPGQAHTLKLGSVVSISVLSSPVLSLLLYRSHNSSYTFHLNCCLLIARCRHAGIYQPPLSQQDSVVTNLLEIRHSLNEATSSTLQQFIYSSSVSNISTQQSGASPAQHQHHHLHYPHLHLHGAGSFLRDNFVSSSASSALNAIMGHHHHQHHQQQHQQQQQLHGSNSIASPTNLCLNAGPVPVGGTSAGGSHSAGVVGSISFSSAEPMPLATSASSNSVTPTPPLQRRLAKSFSVAPSITQQKGSVASLIDPHVVLHLLITFIIALEVSSTCLCFCFCLFLPLTNIFFKPAHYELCE